MEIPKLKWLAAVAGEVIKIRCRGGDIWRNTEISVVLLDSVMVKDKVLQ